MAIPDEFLYEYAVVRYVPRVDREEFINIGLLMMCKRRKWMKGEICLNEERIRAFDPNANIENLQSQARIFTRNDVPSGDLPIEERYRWLTAVKSAVLQVSPSHPGMVKQQGSTPGEKPDEDYKFSEGGVEKLETEFERLLKMMVKC